MRDKKVGLFDNNREDGLLMEDLVNLECLYMTHNLINDLYGVS